MDIWHWWARPLIIAAALLVLAASGASAEKRVALVIGNSAYKNVVALTNPTNDATAIAALLKSSGFDVVEAKNNLDNAGMRRIVRYFIEQTQDADVALVYYAGHGIEVGGVNYLIPVDAVLEHDIDVQDEALPLDRITEVLEPVKKLRLIILDACRDDPFSKNMKRTIGSRSVGRGLAKIEPGLSNTLIAFAAKAGSTASDGNGDHSPFAKALLDNLGVPGVDIRIALGRVRDEVYKRTSGRQEPFVYGSLGGGIVSLVPPKPAAPPAPIAPAADNYIRDYQLARDINTVEAWDSFIAAHPNSGFYYNLAKAARDKIAAQRKQLEDAQRMANEQAQRPHPEKPPTAVALAAPNATGETRQGISSSDIAGLLQLNLKRVGCDPGQLDGIWNEKTSNAMARFNAYAHTKFDVKVASFAALETVKQQRGRICPLTCDKGFRIEGDACVAVTCKRGEVLKNGVCVSDTRAAERPAQEGSGQDRILCDNRGCRQVPKNCHSIYNGSNLPSQTAGIVCD